MSFNWCWSHSGQLPFCKKIIILLATSQKSKCALSNIRHERREAGFIMTEIFASRIGQPLFGSSTLKNDFFFTA